MHKTQSRKKKEGKKLKAFHSLVTFTERHLVSNVFRTCILFYPYSIPFSKHNKPVLADCPTVTITWQMDLKYRPINSLRSPHCPNKMIFISICANSKTLVGVWIWFSHKRHFFLRILIFTLSGKTYKILILREH